ncbi:MAG: 4Fe-4S binding protein, partial [Phycisphaerales bacterium]
MPTANTPRQNASCGTRLSLPVLAASKPKKSRNSPRRAIVLSVVYLLMTIHLLQWLYVGMTISPIEPSESMYALELGKVNAGFVFFSIALLATFIFGRFVCGWGCHIVALQDLCSHWMTKLGVRPKPWRTRLLLWCPLLLALYMFVYPAFERYILVPSLKYFKVPRADWPFWLTDPGSFPGFHSAFVVKDFWATFPEWYIAIPFLLICGFATVYFLGSKAFCSFGCPYGGFFGVIDRVSIGRIVVNDSCEQCGHCTAACTSNVRVHQ